MIGAIVDANLVSPMIDSLFSDGNTPTPPVDQGFLLNDTGGYILNDTGGKLIIKE